VRLSGDVERMVDKFIQSFDRKMWWKEIAGKTKTKMVE
jgi:hypothetical protein